MLTRLQTLPNEVEAIMLAQILEGEGIPAVVRPLNGGYGIFGATQWIHHGVYVDAEDLEKATAIMESVEIVPEGEGQESVQS
jgi:hypothetical protein